MAPWLSEEWALQVEGTASTLPALDGASATVRLAIAVGRRQEVRLSWRYLEGTPGPPTPGDDGPADLELAMGAEDAAELFSGRVEPSVSFMRGRLKATGDGALLLGFLASTPSESFESWRDHAFALADPGTRPGVSS